MPRKRKPIEAPSMVNRLVAAPLEGSAPTFGTPELQVFDYKLRISGELRQRIERAAEANRTSANREMIDRLTRSFDYPAIKSIEAVAADMDATWGRFSKVFHDLSTRGDLVRAAETLVEAVEHLPAAEQKPLKEVIERVRAATNVVNIEAAVAMRRFHTS